MVKPKKEKSASTIDPQAAGEQPADRSIPVEEASDTGAEDAVRNGGEDERGSGRRFGGEAWAALRRQAETVLLQRGGDLNDLSESDIMTLVHELQVHQVELEMQNEELRMAQLELQQAAERFSSLYDFAPVAYLSLDDDGVIAEANLMLAHQLGLARDQLVGAPLSRFVHSDDQSEYHLFRRRLSRTRRIENCELRLRGPEAREFWAHLEGSRWPADANGRIWRLAVSDVTERRRATELLKGLTRELERRVEDRTARLNTANQKLLSEIDQRRKVELLLRNREELLEQRVEERTRTLQSLLDISHNVVSTLQLQQVVSLILDHLQRVVGYTGCTVYLLEHDVLRVLDYRGPLDKDEALRIQLPLDETAGIRDVVLERTSVIIDDLESDSPAALQWRAAAQPAQLRLLGRARSWMAVPLLSKARVIGALRLDHEQGGYFTEQHAQLALAIANQTAVAVENARLYQQAQQLAAVEERQRLAGELHDSVAQTFYSIALAAHTVKGSPSAADAKAALAVDRILSLCDAGLAEIRGVIFALRPETIEREGLVRGLERQVAALRAREDVEIATALGEEPRASLEVKEALYRIAQEALRNVLRHASARHATIRLAQHGDHVELEVTDDGLGFDVNASYPGLGLRSMRERAARLRGRLETTSAPGQGTRVVVRVASGAGG